MYTKRIVTWPKSTSLDPHAKKKVNAISFLIRFGRGSILQKKTPKLILGSSKSFKIAFDDWFQRNTLFLPSIWEKLPSYRKSRNLIHSQFLFVLLVIHSTKKTYQNLILRQLKEFSIFLDDQFYKNFLFFSKFSNNFKVL